MQDNYFNSLSIETKKDIHIFIGTIKEDLKLSHPPNTYLSEVLTIYTNNMIDTLNQYLKNPKQPLYNRFEKYRSLCLNFTEGTTREFLSILYVNLECLKEILIDIEYYEPLKLIDLSIKEISKCLVYIK